MSVPGSWRGVRNRLRAAPEDIQSYFYPVEELLEHYASEISLSYLFSRVERAHLMSLYCGVVKLHRADAAIAAKAIDAFENRHKDFLDLFCKVFGSGVPNTLVDEFKKAQRVRNRVVHGKRVSGKDYRMAVVAIIDYATGFNQTCCDRGGFLPFGKLQGFKGATSSMDKSTTRWMLKGMDFPLG